MFLNRYGAFFSIKVIRKGYPFCQNGTQEVKGLDLEADLPV